VTTIWYRVRDLDSARTFYARKLGFTVKVLDADEEWVVLERGNASVGLILGEPETDGAVAHVDVPDVKRVAEDLRANGVDVGVVLELHGEMRLLDVFDPDGNRVQFAEELPGS
jgi:catechol 2,3-dioxygenase-like lactoylglutathione lyase family enzyme